MNTEAFKLRTVGCAILLAVGLSGCSSYKGQTVPAACLGPAALAETRTNKVPINYIRLRQDPPEVYELGPGDVLGIYIEGVTGTEDEPPPVHFAEDSSLEPAIGYPIPVREDGTLSLPLVPAIPVEGLTLTQTEARIRKAYTRDRQILKPDRDQIIVTLIKARTYRVLVIREDTSVTPQERTRNDYLLEGTSRRGDATVVELDAYENDVLHALSESGGLPGVDAKNQITILRGGFRSSEDGPEIPDGFMDLSTRDDLMRGPNVQRIPLRVDPNAPVQQIREEDIILRDGDVVVIESRDAEVFYTGGLLEGGRYPVPRDYDLDVMGAIAVAGGSFGAGGGGRNQGFVGLGGVVPPTRVIVLRRQGGQQIPIEIDLREALFDASSRIIIQPGDFILLEYTHCEMISNVALSMLQFGGIFSAFR